MQFTYDEITTGHSLQVTKVGNTAIKKLKAFCKKHQCQPRSIDLSGYAFMADGRTMHRLVITCIAGAGNVKEWLERTPCNWQFMPLDDSPLEATA